VARAPRRRLRRIALVVVVLLVVAAVVVAIVAVVRSRQVERSAPALCEQLAEAQDLDQSLTTLDPATLDPQVAALEQAARVAPEEISDAVGTLADYVSEVADQVDQADGDRRQALADALAARQQQVDAVAAAGAEVEAWAATNCGLTLSGPAPDPGATPPDTASDG
jgi:biopolymer transport protein ExbB/TolQ